MENKLLIVKHPERGIWYFTNMQKAANWMGIKRTTLLQCMGKRKLEYKDYTFEWIDGSDILYKYINPEKNINEQNYETTKKRSIRQNF